MGPVIEYTKAQDVEMPQSKSPILRRALHEISDAVYIVSALTTVARRDMH